LRSWRVSSTLKAVLFVQRDNAYANEL